MHLDSEFDREEFLQRVRSDAFKKISRRSMNQWRVLRGMKRGRLDMWVYRYLERVAEYFGDRTEGIDECRLHGIELPDHADDIVDWINAALTWDELDAWRFRLNNYQYLRAA